MGSEMCIRDRTMRSQEVQGLEQNISNTPCPRCRVAALQIAEKTEVIEELAELAEKAGANVEVLSTETEEGEMLLKSFGGVAAILRYKLQG